MTQTNTLSPRTQEEIVNITLHGFGLLLSLMGFGIMVGVAVMDNSLVKVIASSVYCATLIFMYIGSLLFHTSLAIDLSWKKALEVVDHAAIYLLIAGTYTPFLLVILEGIYALTLFCIIWLLALIGIIYKVFFFYKSDVLSTLAYIAMGWLCMFFIKDLYQAMGWPGIGSLAFGGVLYTVGSLFYLFDDRFKYAHALWHLFVMAGSLCHFLTVYFFVIA